MRGFYEYKGFCLCPIDDDAVLPEGATEAPAPFSPLVALIWRNPENSRGIFPVNCAEELFEAEGPGLLLPCRRGGMVRGIDPRIAAIIEREGATALNTAFKRCYEALLSFNAPKKRFKLNLVGLGDVGGALLTGLKLLGEDIASIGIFDPNEKQCQRYEMELNQVLPVGDGALPIIEICREDALFDCDALLFTASRGVPPVGGAVRDVRMAQFDANRAMLSHYAGLARERDFRGLFAEISDPVDQLSRAVFLDSNKNGAGEFDFAGLLPEQVRGYGLGVMRARAMYYAEKLGIAISALRAYGPHGEGLVIANAAGEEYDDALSRELSGLAKTANLAVRGLGFKPYIAPALSSACVSVLRTLRGEWHDAAAPNGGAYFGCRSRLGKRGSELRREEMNSALFERAEEAYRGLKEFDY